jgi:integrase
MTFVDLVEKYEKSHIFPAVIRNGVKVAGLKSARTEKINLNTLAEYFGKKKIRSIKPIDIENFKTERFNTPTVHGKERAIASVNRELAALRAILNFAYRHDFIIRNPFEKTKKLISIASEKERERILSFEEEKRLLSFLVGERAHLKPIVICALDTAMRPDEIFKLRWSDVDFDSNTVTVLAENSKVEKERIIGMTSRLRNELELVWEASPKEQKLRLFGIKSIKTAWRTACRLAEISDCRFRDLRHTAISRMVQSLPHAEIMKATGHTQLKTFLRYVNLTKQTANDSAHFSSNYLEKKLNVEGARSLINNSF